jgi:hypothetical protein
MERAMKVRVGRIFKAVVARLQAAPDKRLDEAA